MTYPGIRAYAGAVTVAPPIENATPAEGGQGDVRMTPAAIEALRALDRGQAESVARAIAAIGHVEGSPVPEASNGKHYLALVPDDDKAPVVMYRRANRGTYLVTALVDRDTYQAYEIAEDRGFLDSSAVRATAGAVAAAAAALGIVLGARASRSRQLGKPAGRVVPEAVAKREQPARPQAAADRHELVGGRC
jgi:hypothetical protein